MKGKRGHRTPEKVTLGLQLQSMGPVVAEHRFHPVRQWRFDYAFLREQVAVEFDGGIWMRPGTGAHNRPANIVRDIDKSNEAQLLGWMVIRVTRDTVRSGQAYETIAKALNLRRRPQPG